MNTYILLRLSRDFLGTPKVCHIASSARNMERWLNSDDFLSSADLNEVCVLRVSPKSVQMLKIVLQRPLGNVFLTWPCGKPLR